MAIWPDTLSINAYLGEDKRAVSGLISDQAKSWTLRNAPPTVRTFLKPPTPADPRNWRDSRIGWGLVLAESAGCSEADLASGADAPEPIQALLKVRGNAPVFRYRPDWQHRFRLLRNYATQMDVAISGSPTGTAPGALPSYLLIYGTPEQVPWELQYILNARCAVGRLDLTGTALENYVQALMTDWQEAAARSDHTLVWAVNHGGSDITKLMRDVIAAKVHEKLASDTQIGSNAVFLDGANQATSAALVQALATSQPGLVVTTSHGQTFPLDNVDLLKEGLGLLVDQDYTSLSPSTLLTKWQPDGAIWYAHACCSAGSDSQTLFNGLVDEGSEIDRVLKGVARVGARVSPLPTALLGASKPLRAFVGHVEPTFDWTLREPNTNQELTDTIQKALYNELYRPAPLGFAFRERYGLLGSLYTSYESDRRSFNEGGNTRAAMLKDLLAARDVQSTVILGDPTAMLPSL